MNPVSPTNNPQLYVLSIHDEEPDRPVLAVDLKHILAALGTLAGDWRFWVNGLDAMGAGAELLRSRIAAASGQGVWLSLDELQACADAIDQTIDGFVLAFPKDTAPTTVSTEDLEVSSFPRSRAVCAIVAVDSSYLEVYVKDSVVAERIRNTFHSVVEHNPLDYFA
jgi:hypothetical protein